ncbi:hypothetical protein N8333_02585 [Flavobacteriaceae bacterium]|nr:hypothetical protein [Flavobacteriaceae bacterium]
MGGVSIEVILFGVLISVIVLDLIIKGRKKKSDVDSTLKEIESLSNTKGVNKDIEGESSFSLKEYLVERPKNISIYLLLVIISKILINYSMFKFYWEDGEILEGEPPFTIVGTKPYLKNGLFVIQDYIRYAFEVNLVSFVYAFIVVTFIAFQLNSHIKKR